MGWSPEAASKPRTVGDFTGTTTTLSGTVKGLMTPLPRREAARNRGGFRAKPYAQRGRLSLRVRRSSQYSYSPQA
jgi:hypothetical protein